MDENPRGTSSCLRKPPGINGLVGKKIDIGKLRMFPGKSMVIGNYWEYKTMIYWEFIGNNCGYNNEAPLAVIMMILNHLIVANYWDAIMIFLLTI